MSTRTVWSSDQVAYLQAHYAEHGAKVADIAAAVGRTEHQVSNKAYALGLKQHGNNRRLQQTVRARSQVLAAAAVPAGVRSTEVSGLDVESFTIVATALVREGLLFRARLSHRNVRYFTDEAAAASYQQQHATTRPGRNMPPPAGSPAARAWWPKDAEPVITSKTKVTIAPPPARPLRTNTHSVL